MIKPLEQEQKYRMPVVDCKGRVIVRWYHHISVTQDTYTHTAFSSKQRR